jgi:cyclophilin family peptidyl-prolyl cis-trans isomerase
VLPFSGKLQYIGYLIDMKKQLTSSLFITTFLVISAITLAACTPPNPEGDRVFPSEQQQNTLGYSQNALGSNKAPANQTSQNAPAQNTQKGPAMKTLADFEKIEATQAAILTNKGEIVFTLYGDKVPTTVANFLNLAKSGFYEGIKFHRIIPDFMAQVGDPLTKDAAQQQLWGTGGPGYVIADEFDPTLKHDSEGTVSMANAGPNTGGSQFFITFSATPWLDGKHAVFGKVIKGMDVLKQLVIGDEIIKVTYK